MTDIPTLPPTPTPDAAATLRAAQASATADAAQVQAAIAATLVARQTETAVATRLTPEPTPTPDAPATARAAEAAAVADTAAAAQVEAAVAATVAAHRTATAVATRLTPEPTFTPTPAAPQPETVSLEQPDSVRTAASNLGLERGRNTLLGVPFDTQWQASTQCSNMADRPETIVLKVAIPHPSAVYLLLQAGWGMNEYAGRRIGSVRLLFADGATHDTPLVLGDNIRDWTRDNTVAVTTATSPELRSAWEGFAPDGSLGGMDILTIRVPDKQARSTLTRIEVTDSSQRAGGDMNPCIHLLGLTVYR